jgi:hypothetical protein
MMKDRVFKVFLLIAVLTVFAACDNQFEGFTKGESMMTFTTMNLRLGDELPFYDERSAVKLDVLSEADADVVCIQELYYSKDILKVKEFFEKDLEYSKPLWLITNEDDFEPIPPACTQADVAPIISCYMENCTGSTDQTCIVTNCWSVFLAMPQVCQTCLLGQGIGAIAGGDIQAVLQGCMTETKFDYNYDGNNGVLLVSKYPMKDKGSLALTSYGNYRMAIYATVQTGIYKPGIGDVQVICTGLSKLSDAEYGGLAGGWAQEQMTQVSESFSVILTVIPPAVTTLRNPTPHRYPLSSLPDIMILTSIFQRMTNFHARSVLKIRWWNQALIPFLTTYSS